MATKLPTNDFHSRDVAACAKVPRDEGMRAITSEALSNSRFFIIIGAFRNVGEIGAVPSTDSFTCYFLESVHIKQRICSASLYSHRPNVLHKVCVA